MPWRYHSLLKFTTLIYSLIQIAFAQSGSSVYDNPTLYNKDYSILDCFKNLQYKGTFKADTIKSNYVLKGQKIWRSINLQNKENELIFNHTSTCSEVSLFEIMKYGIFEKKLNVFSSDDFNEVKTHRLTQQQITQLISFKDSAKTLAFDANGNETSEISKTNRYLMGSDIAYFLLKENWITNSNTGKLEKVIIGIAPLFYIQKTEKTMPLFWLYYPEWKELFSSFKARNYYSEEQITFNDVLQRKLFISLISKESNMFDRSIKSTFKDRDFYLESENIKERIINYEEDLFSH